MALVKGLYKRAVTKETARSNAELQAEAELYRKALEKATYQQLGPEYAGSLNQATNYIAGLGPLADSGARTAIGTRLASQYLQRAQGQIGGGYADMLGNLIRQRQQYQYQMALLRQQKKMQSTGFGGVAGGVAGAFGGPLLGAAGTYLGNKWAGGGKNPYMEA